jgi:NAD(P)-dependent dehydrogenase (short-subunit alcohol dehydrogenase family)
MKQSSLLWIAGGVLGLFAGMAIASAKRLRQYTFYGRVVVITGGSRGLGLAMARQFAQQGARLALLARNPEELLRAEQALASTGASVLTIPCDIRKREQVESAIQQTVERFGRIDVLVNNAGIIQVGPLEHMTLEDFEQCMDIHFRGALYTIFAALPHMRRARSGRIVNISSIGGKIAVPHMAPYSASKFALTGLSDALRSELRRDNIYVTTVLPGLLRTGSPPNAQFKGKFQNEYAWFTIGDSLPFLSLDANRAAGKILRACRRGAPRLVVGFPAKAAVTLHDLFPNTAAQILSLINSALPKPDPELGNESHSGWESQSRLAPKMLTRLSDKATIEHNQTPF